MVTYTEKRFKSILNRHKYIDNWFWGRYGVNGYNGCRFGCVYCDSRSARYHLPTDFDSDIVVKTGAGEMLDSRITRARTLLPDVVCMSGASDPYQPAERKYGNTRQVLEVLARHRWPVHIITKSALVLRDLDLLERIGKQTWANVSVTITTTNADVARFLERRAPAPEERFGVIREIKARTEHVQTGVLAVPLVPCLCDSDGDMENLVRKAKGAGADYMLFGGGMTLRDVQADWYLKHLHDRYPDLIPRYEELYGFKYKPVGYDGSYGTVKSHSTRIHKKMFALLGEHGLPWRIPRFIPRDFRKHNYIIAEKLFEDSFEAQMRGKPWTKKHWAGMNIQNLTESIVDVAARGELGSIRNVEGEVEEFILANLPRRSRFF